MNMCKSSKRKTVPELCLKGQVFFIWSTYQSLEIVKDRISLLGGKVDPFLSRDVTTVLVEDNHLLGSQAKPSYAANGTVVTSFPYQSIPSTSRGVLGCASASSPYRVICYALQWGIQVLGIDQFLTWIEPQVKTAVTLRRKPAAEKPAAEKPAAVSKLSGCFVKFESFYKNYRPCYKMFNNDPDRLLPLKNASVLVKAENCNIVLDQPNIARQIHFKQISIVVPVVKNINLPFKANERKVPNNKLKPKDENNYCECCRTHFADLKSHIKSVKHQNFVSNEKNYEIVQNIIRMLPTAQEFINKLQNSSPDPGQVVRNAEVPQSAAVASNNPSLNLQLIEDNVVLPMDLHVEKGKAFPEVINDKGKPSSGAINDKDENSLPLDLVKRVSDAKNEIKPDDDLLNQIEENIPSQKHAFGPSAFQEGTKTNISIKLEEPDPNIPCDGANGDPLATTAALAQLCLKNFDSYWLDNLPCEMDDMVFEDIFDLDDAKGKLETDNDEAQFLPSDTVQTPGFVSGISTPSFKTPTNTNMSFCMNSSLDMKDAKSESVGVLSSCKPEKVLNDASSQNVTEQSVELKKKIFSIATYCANKVEACSSKVEVCSSKVDPSCSNANTELLFSSDTSDSENEHALISNVLSFINNNSDSELGRKSANQNVSCSKGFPFLGKSVMTEYSTTIPNQNKTRLEADSSGKRQSSVQLDSSDASEFIPAKKLCSSVDPLRTINVSAIDLASSKNQATPCQNISNGRVQMPTEPSVNPLSFAKMKMKISPKDVHEDRDLAQSICNPDSNQNSISSKMTCSESRLLNNYACLRNSVPYNYVPLPETVIPQNLPLNLKAPEQKQDLYRCVKPKHDFSIAHLTNDVASAPIKREDSSSPSKPMELDCTQPSSVPPQNFAKRLHIPSKSLDVDSEKHQTKVFLPQPFADASSGKKASCKAFSVLPKKAYRRKYVLPTDDQKQLNNENTITLPLKESQGGKKMTSCSDLKCLNELEGKSKFLALKKDFTTDFCDLTDEGSAHKGKILPNQTSVKNELSLGFSLKAPVASEESSFKKHCLEAKDQVKLSLVSVGNQGSLKAFTVPKVVTSEASSSIHPAAEFSSSNSTQNLLQMKSSALRVLPSHWTVSVLPGSGVKLKFTCVHPPKLENQGEAAKR